MQVVAGQCAARSLAIQPAPKPAETWDTPSFSRLRHGMGNIDRADWHYGGDGYPGELPPENGGTHIGMYLAWIIQRDLGSAQLRKYARDSLPLLKGRKITGRQLLLTELDEKFFEGLLTRLGKDFTKVYYDSDCYIEDYVAVLCDGLPSVYHVEDSWENYDRIAAVIDDRYARWQKGEVPPPSPQQLAFKQAADQCIEVILAAARRLPSDPSGAIALLEAYLAGDILPAHRKQATRELEIIRAKYA